MKLSKPGRRSEPVSLSKPWKRSEPVARRKPMLMSVHYIKGKRERCDLA